MSGEPPNVGDLARIVKVCGCPESQSRLDQFVTVTAIDEPVFDGLCVYCLHAYPAETCCTFEPMGRLPRAWLRRIKPLDELESIDIVTEVESERPRRERVPV